MSTRSVNFLQKVLFTGATIVLFLPMLIGILGLIINVLNFPSKKIEITEVLFQVVTVFKKWSRGITLTSIIMAIFLLGYLAKESGRVDAEEAVQNAPQGRVLLTQQSIPELTYIAYPTKNNDFLYDYGLLNIVGTLGDNYLISLKDKNGKITILSIPSPQVVSINYVDFVSLTPVPTLTATSTSMPNQMGTTTPIPPTP